MAETLVESRPVLRIGRAKAGHRPRVLIEDDRVVIRTACGINPLDAGFIEEHGFITCEDCGGAQ